MKVNFARESSEQTANDSLNLNGADIISVVREAGTDNDWRPCREIPLDLQSRVTDTTSLHYASEYAPVYMLGDDGAISVFPAPGSNPNTFKVYYANNVPVDKSGANLLYSHSDIGYFNDDKVYLVVTYASMKSLQAAMSGLHSNSAIDTTAMGAVVTELNKVDNILVEASTEFDEAKNLSEAYNSGDLNTALGLIKTAADSLATAGDKWEGASESIWGMKILFNC